MRLSSSLRSNSPLVLALALVLAAPARGETIRLAGGDERGVTLQLDVGPFRLRPTASGRFELTGTGLPNLDLPGRARLPYGYALIAVPPGANVIATVSSGAVEETQVPGKLVIGDRPVVRDHHDGFGPIPEREPAEPIADGPWPPSPVELGTPFTVRHQTLVAVQVKPFQYDEATGRLWTRRSITVRLDFGAGSAAGARAPVAPPTVDRNWEPVLKGAVLNYEQGRRWRAEPARARAPFRTGSLFGPPAGVAGAPQFDESETEVRVRVDSTGVIALEYSKLAAAGFPAGVPIGEISVHRHEFTGYGSPPYETIELPIEIDDKGVKGTFDAGDQILVWVQNWAERSRASPAQRAWGDGEVIYVTRLRTRAPLRVGLRPGWLGTAPPVLTSYPWSQRIEHNLYYLTLPPDTSIDLFLWTDIVDYYTRSDSIQFEVNQLDPSHTVNFAVQLQGRKELTHYNWIAVKNGAGQLGMVADSVRWSGRVLQNFPAVLPGSAITEGRTNRLVLWGKDFDLPPDPITNGESTAGLNGFDMTYWRSYRALAGQLPCNSGDQTGDFEIQAGGFDGDSIRVWDVGDSTSVVRLSDVVIDYPTRSVRFQDNTPGPRRNYVVFNRGKTLLQNKYSAVTPHQLYARGSGDYLLVTPEAFLPAANALAALRGAEGLDVVVAPLEAVNDEFNGGRHSSYAIRRFVRYAYDNWNARFVLLMGDGSEDPLNAGGEANPDWIPAQKVQGPVGVFVSGGFFNEAVPSDTWYVWSVDTPPSPSSPGNPLLPDLFIGRLPVNSLAQANAVVSKLSGYEQVDTTQTWRRRILLHADDAWSGETTFGGSGSGSGYCFRSGERAFVALSRAVNAVIADSSGLGLCEPEVFDMNFWLKDEPQVNGCRPDRDATINYTRAFITPKLFDRLNDGRLWWNYQGHANAQVLEHESIYWKATFPSDLTRFTNDGKPFLFTAFSCHANAFAQPREATFGIGPAIGEEMVTLPNRGAIASWASVGYEIIPSDSTDHLNVTLAKSLFLSPPRDDYLGHGASAVLGEAIAQTLLLNYASRLSNPSERDVAITYALLGDPATRLTVGAPQIIVTANHVPVSDGVPVFLPGQSDTLLLEADLVSNAAIDSISLETTGAGGRTLVPPSGYTLTPPFPDTGPGEGGGRRFHLAYHTQLAVGTSGYWITSGDRYGSLMSFEVVFKAQAVLQAFGQTIRDDDAVAPDAPLSLAVHSPNTLDPAVDIALTVDGLAQAFIATPANNDPTGRQFILSWTHPPYAPASHAVKLTVKGSEVGTYHFRVVSSLRLTGVMSFPNPFDDESNPPLKPGTLFMFNLEGMAPADFMLRVFTVSGRMVYEITERGLQPGHHELYWNGRDAEGDKLANGVYLYRMVAKGSSGSASESGRLVKLRKPQTASDTGTP